MGSYGVTGSASGIGAALVERLRAEGHDVIGVDVRRDVEGVVADLGTGAGRAGAIEAVLDRSDGHLDGFVACAGVAPTARAELLVSINYFGAVTVLEGVREALSAAAGAAVVLSSNSVALTPMPDLTGARHMLAGDEPAARVALRQEEGPVVYAMTKWALASWVRRSAASWGEAGVRLNAVAPGPIETPILEASRGDPDWGRFVDALPIPLGRTGRPAEIAAAVAFLLGPDASYLHGSVLFADAGIDATTRPDHV